MSTPANPGARASFVEMQISDPVSFPSLVKVAVKSQVDGVASRHFATSSGVFITTLHGSIIQTSFALLNSDKVDVNAAWLLVRQIANAHINFIET